MRTTSRPVRETTCITAHAAVMDVLACVDAGSVAGRLAGRACDLTHPVHAMLTGRADLATCTTVVGVGARVPAGSTAGRLTGRAVHSRRGCHSWSLLRRAGRFGGFWPGECQCKSTTHQCRHDRCCQARHDRTPLRPPTRGWLMAVWWGPYQPIRTHRW